MVIVPSVVAAAVVLLVLTVGFKAFLVPSELQSIPSLGATFSGAGQNGQGGTTVAAPAPAAR